jgi:NAD(P)-dependent dehydrogenase (short-subunit alcohol dehydrogenase family)
MAEEKIVSSAMEEVLDIIPPPEISLEAQGKAPGRGRLIGKHILVVGGGQSVNSFDAENPPIGNGRASCVLMAREGATVVVADLSAEAAQGTVDMIEKEGVGKAIVVVGDVSTPEGCSGIIQDSLKALDGQLDGLVIGVGIVGAGASIPHYSAAYWDRVMNINVRSHFLLLQEALPYIEKRPAGGSVVSISSISQYLPASNEPAYNASKAALSVLIKNVAYQFAPRVRVNTVVPGLIDTPMGRSAGTKIKGRNASAVPLARQGSGWDIGYAVTFLMSGESSFITATDMIVDGGYVGMGSKTAKKPNQELGVS